MRVKYNESDGEGIPCRLPRFILSSLRGTLLVNAFGHDKIP
jgi:hypothetical protein